MKTAHINLLNVYHTEPPYPAHSFLVDRLWPRGVRKEKLQGVEWLKDVAPTTELRQWFHQNHEEWDTFQKQYRKELTHNEAVWQPLLDLLVAGKTIALLSGNKDEEHNQAVVLREFLMHKVKAAK
jgi:Uncharacterized conserved protein